MPEIEAETTDTKVLRRRIAAAKSYLSRLHNESTAVLHSTRADKSEAYRALYDKRAIQEQKFRDLVKELRRREGRE